MMTRILKSGAFVLAVILMLSMLSCFLQQRYDQMQVGKMNYHFAGIYGEKPNSIDVLLIGDSECYSGFSPMEMWETQGFTAYGAGTLAQNLQETYEYLKDILRHQSPSVVVLETDSIFSIFTEVPLDNILKSEMRMAFPGIADHDSWRTLFSRDTGARYVDDSKGYYHVYEAQTPKEHHIAEFMAPDDRYAPMDAKRQWILGRIRDLCEVQGIQLVLVSTPSTKNWNMQKHNTVAQWSEQWKIPYLDLNLLTEEMGFDWTRHTQDGGDHLNHAGAELVSRYLAGWLTEEFDLKDHRQDLEFVSWQDSLEIYRDRVENRVVNKEPMYRKTGE